MTTNLEAGIKFYKMRRWDTAYETLREGMDKADDADKEESVYYMGLCCAKLSRWEDALQYLEQIVTAEDTKGPRVVQCRLSLAYIYMITKRARMADFELDRLQKAGYNAATLWNLMGYSAWSQHDNDKAVQYYTKALSLDKNNATAMNGLGFILADTEKDFVRALMYCKKAVEKKPQDAAFLDSLGWAYFKVGSNAEARTWLRRALDIAPREPEIREHMKTVVGEAD
jgi:Tfp pilus assembly protein PilF